MAIPAPVILLPTGGTDYTTDMKTQTLSGTTSADTESVLVNGSTQGVSYTEGETVWAWTGDLQSGTNTLNITAKEKVTHEISDPATIVITLVDIDDFVTVAAPTGVRTRRYVDSVEVITAENTEVQVVGYNFYVYTQSGGDDNEYVQINKQLVTDPSFYEDKTKIISDTENRVGNIIEERVLKEVARTNYYSYTFDQDRFNELVEAGSLPDVTFSQDTSFFFVITAVLYDTSSGQVTESSYSVELESAPITITTDLVTLPSRPQSAIILTYSQELLTGNAGIDTKPGTVIRDMIDPISEEQARIYVIQDFLDRKSVV